LSRIILLFRNSNPDVRCWGRVGDGDDDGDDDDGGLFVVAGWVNFDCSLSLVSPSLLLCLSLSLSLLSLSLTVVSLCW